MTHYLCMPSDFNLRTLEEYAALNSQFQTVKVYESYGSLNPSPVAAGRQRVSPWLPSCDLPHLQRYIERSEELGMHFNYVLNSACTGGNEFDPVARREYVAFVSKLMEHGVKSVTVVTPSWIQILKSEFPDLYICTSTIAEIETVQAAKTYESFGVDRIIVAEDVQRQFDTLRRIRRATTKPLEVLTNTTCLFQCAWRKSHYNMLSHTQPQELDIEAYYHWQCMSIRATKPIELMKLRWVRPEDLPLYKDITYLKVVGRYFAQDSDLVRVARLYMEGSFDGNLWELIGNFAPQRKHGFYIDNKALDGFVAWWAKSKKNCKHLACDDCNHCAGHAERAVRLPQQDGVNGPLLLQDLKTRIDDFHQQGTHIQRVSEIDAFTEMEA
ncbi:MAG: U32 family peptidase [Myxococcota bacterium]|nr:U32 family peptidase [Myxococcota bacterium]